MTKKPVTLITGYLGSGKTTYGKVDIEKIVSEQKFNYEMVDSSSAIQKAINSLVWFKERPQDVLLFEQIGRVPCVKKLQEYNRG